MSNFIGIYDDLDLMGHFEYGNLSNKEEHPSSSEVRTERVFEDLFFASENMVFHAEPLIPHYPIECDSNPVPLNDVIVTDFSMFEWTEKPEIPSTLPIHESTRQNFLPQDNEIDPFQETKGNKSRNKIDREDIKKYCNDWRTPKEVAQHLHWSASAIRDHMKMMVFEGILQINTDTGRARYKVKELNL